MSFGCAIADLQTLCVFVQLTAKVSLQTLGEAVVGPNPTHKCKNRQLHTICKTSWSRVRIICVCATSICWVSISIDYSLHGTVLVSCTSSLLIFCRLGATGLSLTSTVVLVGLARPAVDGNNLHKHHHADSQEGNSLSIATATPRT